MSDKLFPAEEWTVEDPGGHGLDASLLEQAAAAVRKIEKRYGFLVVKDGVIVHETYYLGDQTTKHPVFSVTKGFGASLVGIAQTRGFLDVKDLVSDWLPVHHPHIKEGATIEHILSMTGGGQPGVNTYLYTSGPILNSLSNILWLATGKPPARFFDEDLAEPLGLTLDWPRNGKGWMQIGNRGPLPVLHSTHRDLARLGLLWLRKGNWRGQQLIATEFIDAALRPPFPEANNAYGYLWWLNKDGGQWRDPRNPPVARAGKRIPGAPESVYTAQGARGKLIMVIPDHDMVVVTMGETGDEHQPTLDLWAAIAPALAR